MGSIVLFCSRQDKKKLSMTTSLQNTDPGFKSSADLEEITKTAQSEFHYLFASYLECLVKTGMIPLF